jgi:nitrate/nitrite transporter NarK
MNRTTIILLVLLTISAIVGFFVLQDPQRADRIAQMQREVAFQGQAREIAMLVFFVVVGGFVAYLLFTRRS